MLLETFQLARTYRRRGGAGTCALQGLELKVEEGEMTALMGPSGCGKTTLMHLLAGLDKPDAGEVHLRGENLSAMNEEALALFRRREMGFVFQDFNLVDSLTLEENICLPLILDREDPEIIRHKGAAMLRRLGLTEAGPRFPESASGGQQQRAAIGRALIRRPSLILADEPTGNLDSASAASVMDFFTRMQTEDGCTLLMVTHDPSAASFCRRVVFMKDGQLVGEIHRQGSRQQFFDDILAHMPGREGVSYDDT